MIILINREKNFSNILSNEEDSKRKKFLKAALVGPVNEYEYSDRDIPYNFIGYNTNKLLAKAGKHIGNEKIMDIGIKGMARSNANIRTAISNDEKKRSEIYYKSLDTYRKKYLSEN